MLKLLLLGVCAVSLAACAGDGPPEGRPGGGPPGMGGGRFGDGHGPHGGGPGGDMGDHPGGGFGGLALFVSPCGEPFRAPPGDPYPVGRWFAAADANHDGRLDRAEFVADAMRFFATLDLDGDGYIDGRELRRYEHDIVPEMLRGGPGGPGGPQALLERSDSLFQLAQMGGGMGGMGGGMGGGPGGGMGGGHGGRGGQRPPEGSKAAPGDGTMSGLAPYTFLAEPEPVAASDLSFTGRVRNRDFATRAGQRFEALDTEQKGYLTLDTLPKTRAQEMGGGPGQGRGPRRGGRPA